MAPRHTTSISLYETNLRWVVSHLSPRYDSCDYLKGDEYPWPLGGPIIRSKTTTNEKVVVLLNNGTRCKGTIDSFDPKNRTLLVKETGIGGSVVAIRDLDMRAVHTIFFVHDLALMRTRRLTSQTAQRVPPKLPQNGRMLRVTFLSGEVIDGMSYDYEPSAEDFFLSPNGPLNRAYNIERVYISRQATARVEVVSGAGPQSDRPRAEPEKKVGLLQVQPDST